MLRSMFLIICLIFVSSCKTSGTGGSNKLRNSSGSASESGLSMDCPNGVGIDGSTGRYQSCDCPPSHPLFDRSSGKCMADISCKIETLHLSVMTDKDGKVISVSGLGSTADREDYTVILNSELKISRSRTEVSFKGRGVINNGEKGPVSIKLTRSTVNAMVTIDGDNQFSGEWHKCVYSDRFTELVNK
jgi:hypothetical protein